MKKEWLEYEKLVARVYTILNAKNDALVTHNDFLIGKDSNRKRQIDVSIKFTIPGNHQIIIVISCKNYNKKPNIRLIDEFYGLLEDVKANKGILICKAGFGNSILAYAKKKGIDLCTVEDAEKLNVLEDLRIPISFLKFDYNFGLQTSVQTVLNQSRNLKLELHSKKLSFDKTYLISISEYILEYWRLNKLDEIHEPFKKEIIIDRVYYYYENNWYLLFDLKITLEKILEIKYLLFAPKEYYKIKHYTEPKEERTFLFTNDLLDFENVTWEKEKPSDFESNLFLGNFLFITSNELLTKEILDEYNL